MAKLVLNADGTVPNRRMKSGEVIATDDAVISLQGAIGATGGAGTEGPAGPAGPQGPAGPTGPQGPAGPQGDPGPKGDTGAQGSAGPQGIKGDTGSQGPQGPQGLQGTAGAQGQTGPQGEVGPAGQTGGQGLQGIQGPKGDKGDTGDPGQTGPAGADATPIPAGVIVMWGGLLANIPAGWVLCNGLNGTPDLRDRFIKGAANGANPGGTGGSASHGHADHTLSGAIAGEAAHTHTYTQVPNHVHVEQLQGGTTGATGGTHLMGSTATGGSLRSSAQSTLNPTGGVATGTSAAGASHTHGNGTLAVSAHGTGSSEPVYYALCFIQKV